MKFSEIEVLGEATGRQTLLPLNLGLSPSTHKLASARVGGPRVATPGNSSNWC